MMTTMITEEVDQQMQPEVPAIGSAAIRWSAKALLVNSICKKELKKPGHKVGPRPRGTQFFFSLRLNQKSKHDTR